MIEGLLQPGHLLLILIVALLLFGPQKLPQLGKGLGEAIRNFKEGLNAPPADSSAREEQSRPKTEAKS